MRHLGLAILLAYVPGLAFAESFDLVALRKLPDIAALEAGCAPPLLGYSIPVPPAQLVAAANPLPPDRQALAWLLFLHGDARDGDPMAFSLQAPADAILGRVRAAMLTAGMAEKVASLDRARRTVRSIGDLLRMEDVEPPPAFGSKAAFAADIVAYVGRTPTLAACLATARATLPDDVRVGVLDQALVTAFASGADPKDLPSPYRVIWLANQYVGEVDNGGVEQFFANAGPDAPETEAALRTMGLAAQADVIGRGIALFGTLFPTDRDTLLATERTHELGPLLDQLTPAADTREVGAAMAAYARRQDILPK